MEEAEMKARLEKLERMLVCAVRIVLLVATLVSLIGIGALWGKLVPTSIFKGAMAIVAITYGVWIARLSMKPRIRIRSRLNQVLNYGFCLVSLGIVYKLGVEFGAVYPSWLSQAINLPWFLTIWILLAPLFMRFGYEASDFTPAECH
jgi:hypothetical protein